MTRLSTRAAAMIAVLGLLFLARPASAVIPAAFPLKSALENEKFILLVKVEKVLPDKPGMTLTVAEALKGKPTFEKMNVNLTGNDKAQKDEQTAKLLKRVAEGTPLVVLASNKGKKWTAYAFTNGTWFQMLATEDGEKLVWAFQEFEPVLRQTFKGTTEEMKQAVVDGLAGKKDPPGVDLKEKPGIGPELPEKKEEKKSSRGIQTSGPIFAVIPTVAIGGPLAILSMLFPSLFGKPTEILRRWTALLTVTSINSTLYLLHDFFSSSISGYWWGSKLALWMTMTVVTLLGAVWAWQRHRKALKNGAGESLMPGRGEEICFRVLSIIGMVMVAYCLGAGSLLVSPWIETVPAVVVIWAGTLAIVYLRFAAHQWPLLQSRLPLEGVMLGALTLCCFALGTTFLPRAESKNPVVVAPSDNYAVKWEFTPMKDDRPRACMIDSTPLVTEDRVYVSGALYKDGVLYCLDRATGKVLWEFTNEGAMEPVFCTPCIADGLLYVGEGYHQHAGCNMFCLDPKDGKLQWKFETKSHTESTPCVANGKLYFGAGDDGLYCLDAKKGTFLWRFPGMHIDTNPLVVGDGADARVFVGTGYGLVNYMLCLDANSGQMIWREDCKWPVFGSPVQAGNTVIFGSGTGNLLKSEDDPEKRKGAVFCLDIKTGKQVWPAFEVADGVHTHAEVDLKHIYFGSRDGNIYCINRDDGKEVWKHNLGGAVVSSPSVMACPTCGHSSTIYVPSTSGKLFCLDPETGKELWTYAVPPMEGKDAEIVASARVFQSPKDADGHRRIYFAAVFGDRFKDATRSTVFCVEDLRAWPLLGKH